MKCWNEGCNIDIIRGENWTPQNKIWIETSSERSHNFKNCFKKTGNWVSPSGKKYQPIGDPIIDDCNKHYYKQLYYFLKNGVPKSMRAYAEGLEKRL